MYEPMSNRQQTVERYGRLIRQYRDYGPDSDVQAAYEAGLRGELRNPHWSLRRRAAWVAGGIVRRST